MTHLVNRRALGPALPPWLDEGLCGDLSHSEIGPQGEILPALLGGSFRSLGSTRIWWGGRAALEEISRAVESGELLDLETLVGLDWATFVGRQDGQTYPLSALLLRFLLESPELGERFRLFLRDVAEGESSSGEALVSRLGVSWRTLEERFAGWVRMRAASVGEGASPL